LIFNKYRIVNILAVYQVHEKNGKKFSILLMMLSKYGMLFKENGFIYKVYLDNLKT